MKKLHIEDRNVAHNFIDAVRFTKSVSVDLQILARYVAEYVGINPNQSNGRLANAFAKAFETGRIK